MAENGRGVRTSCCFVPGCNTGYTSARRKNKAEGKRNYSLFVAPKDPHLRKRWQQAVHRADRPLDENDCICEIHFKPEDVMKWYDEVTLPDGTISRIKKGRPTLRANSIPISSSTMPGYSSSLNEREIDLDGNEMQTSKSSPESMDNMYSGIETDLLLKTPQENSLKKMGPEESGLEVPTKIDFNFQALINNLHQIKKPSSWWVIASVIDYLICAQWNGDFICEKRVAIDHELNAKVFLGDKSTLPDLTVKITCANDISILLKQVDGFA